MYWQEVNLKGAYSCASLREWLDHTVILTVCPSTGCEAIGVSVLFCTAVVQDQDVYCAYMFPY